MTPVEARDTLTAQGCTSVCIDHVDRLKTYPPEEEHYWQIEFSCDFGMFECRADTLAEAVAEALKDIAAWREG